MLHALYIAILVLLQFGIITVNYRAIAQGRYTAAVLTDAVVCVLNWTLFRTIAEAQPGDVVSMTGYVLGGMAGSILGIWLTRHWQADQSRVETGARSVGA